MHGAGCLGVARRLGDELDLDIDHHCIVVVMIKLEHDFVACIWQ